MTQLRNTVDAHALDLHYQTVVFDLHALSVKEVILLGVHLDLFLYCQFLRRKQPHRKGLLPLHHVLVNHEVLVVLLLALVRTGLRRRRRFLVLHDLQSLFLGASRQVMVEDRQGQTARKVIGLWLHWFSLNFFLQLSTLIQKLIILVLVFVLEIGIFLIFRLRSNAMRFASHFVDPEQMLASVTTKRTVIEARGREDVGIAVLTLVFVVN